jgi:hypothetical protein
MTIDLVFAEIAISFIEVVGSRGRSGVSWWAVEDLNL